MIYEVLEFRDSKSIQINKPSDVTEVLKSYLNATQEQFLCITLDGSHTVIKVNITSIGTINKAFVHPRDVFRNAIKDNACSIIVAHNHPSGHLEPSSDDIESTRALIESGEILGINVLDHIIFQSDDGYYSFTEHNLLFKE